MKRIDKVYDELKKLCIDQYNQDRNIVGISTTVLAKRLNMQRTNVSSDLNMLFRDGRIEKICGKPVIYKIQYGHSEKSSVKNDSYEGIFDSIIGSKQSLKNAVQQAKAAIIYPPRGLHTLLYGETGTGKSMFAEAMYKYAKEIKKIKNNAPFVTFNCADYANNPQLLMSQLFGVKKGTYTGADKDKLGVVEKANGGILFLDEVHRLPPEGQEMLFYLIDKGLYKKLGETEKQHNADVLIICATTEDIQSVLLRTFIRRIPTIIRLPALRDRSFSERYKIISAFFKIEASSLQNDIMVTSNSLKALMLYDCPNNIGQLKSDIKISCAKAFLGYMMKRDRNVCVHSEDLPEYVRRGLFKYRDYKEKIDKYVDRDYIIFSASENPKKLNEDHKEFNLYEVLENRRKALELNGLNEDDIKLIMSLDIEKYLKRFIQNVNKNNLINLQELYKVVDKKIVDIVRDFLDYASNELGKKFDSKILYGLSMHISSSIERIMSGKKIVNHQLEDIKRLNEKEFIIAKKLADKIEGYCNIDVPEDEIGFITMFLCIDGNPENKEGRVGIIIAMHGESTAQSMADVVNRLLKENYAYGYNMPLDQSPEIALENIIEIVKRINYGSGVLLLVDMGSLVLFGDMIYERTGIPVKTVEMVSTPIALEATRKALMGASLEDVYEASINLSPYVGRVYKDNYDFVNGIKKNIIITACITGEGAAVKYKSILEKKLDISHHDIDIIPMDIPSYELFNSKLKKLKESRNILAVVSAIKPRDDTLLYISTSDIFSKKISILDKAIDSVRKIEMISNMEAVIKENVDIDAHRYIGVLKKFYEYLLDNDINMNNESIVGLILHLACVIENILNGKNLIDKEKSNIYSKDDFQNFELIRKGVDIIEKEYGIKISDNECINLIRIIYSI